MQDPAKNDPILADGTKEEKDPTGGTSSVLIQLMIYYNMTFSHYISEPFT